MINIKEKKDCCGCHACSNICPKNAIMMVEDENGFKIPKIDEKLCIDCGLCEKVCPIINNSKIENEPVSYAIYNKDDEIRKNSSSGGIFYLIAKYILDLGGVVFGAKFNEGFEVIHGYIEKEEDIMQFMGSKYIQSTIGNCFKKAKEFLDNDRYVLFSGTPCQIEGLKKYLQKDYEKLYTQDIICHGVPSPMVWREYLKYMKKKFNNTIIKINFRNKDNGWNEYKTDIKYANGEYKENHNKNIYMKVFLSNLCLRESCYDCNFKKKNRDSDVTLADFWGINNIFPELDDDKGISLMIVNSKKGKKILDKIKSNCIYKETDFENSIKYNVSMIKSCSMPENRAKFLTDIKNKSFDVCAKENLPKVSLFVKTKSKLKGLLKFFIKK